MWEIDAVTVLVAVFSALLGVVFGSLKDWLWEKLPAHRGVRIETAEERGPIRREYGFTEKAVKVTIQNESSTKIEIQDIRLMFAGIYGVPVMPKAPLPRSHSQLPTPLESGAAESWYFPAEQLASLIGNLAAKRISKENVAKLRPRVTTTTGKVFRGATRRFSLDIDSH